jgi:hypothetical protein
MHFWGDAVKYAAYVLNRSPCKANPKRGSPIEMLKGKPPNLTHIVTFGSPCMVYRKPGKNSLKKRSQCGLILGISEEVKGFRVYLMDDKKVVTTQHVKYIQTLSRAHNLALLEPPSATIESRNHVNDSFVDVEDTDPATGLAADSPVGGELQHPTPALIERATTRQADKRKSSQRIRDIMASFIQALEDDEDEAIMCNAVATCIDPPNNNAAMKTEVADRWNIAIEDELKSVRDNRTWVVVDKPPDVKPLASRFVFKLKRDSDGAVERYKARLVARGDQQIEGVNYNDTFSPVMDMTTARIIFAFGVIWGNPPRHGDIPVAYTRASPEEDLEIYMYPPQGMHLTEEAISGGNRPVLKLMKNLYGLKQAGRLWHQMLDEKLRALKYSQSNVDMCLYYRTTKTTIILVGIYVDDLLVTSNNVKLIDEFFEQMKTFDVKD